MSDCLVLNASFRPISLIPLSTIIWQDAIKIVYLDKVNVLDYYDNWVVHSPNIEMRVPATVLTKEFFNFEKYIKFSRRHIYMRDIYQCQYCGEFFDTQDLTIDHVIPKTMGGRTEWENVVSCCEPCNSAKGHNSWKPLNKPYMPSYFNMVDKMVTHPIEAKHPSWRLYLEPLKFQVVDKLHYKDKVRG